MKRLKISLESKCMFRNFKVHLFYIVIIISILFIFSDYLFIKIVGFNESSNVVLNKKFNILDRETGLVVGCLEKGVILNSPELNEFEGVDISDNDRYKLIIDLVDINKGDIDFINYDGEKKKLFKHKIFNSSPVN